MNNWISVEERFPENGQNVLVHWLVKKHSIYDESSISTASFEITSIGYILKTDHFCERNYFEEVTHWMPLPKLPEKMDEN